MTPQYVYEVSYRNTDGYSWRKDDIVHSQEAAMQSYRYYLMSDTFQGEVRLIKGIISPNTGDFRPMYVLEYFQRG